MIFVMWNANRTRRWFLLRAIGASALAMAANACARALQGSRAPLAPSPSLGGQESSLLRSVVDELVPAADGMPAASDVGSLAYLMQLASEHAEVRAELEGALAHLATLSRDGWATPFTSLSHPHRLRVLTEMENRAPREFAILRDYTYEAYYTRPLGLAVDRLRRQLESRGAQDRRWAPRPRPSDAEALSPGCGLPILDRMT